MNILVVAPHPDDESIGCGGAVCLHAQRGNEVSVAFLTSGELGLKHLPREEAWRTREKEARKAAAVLGIGELTFLRRRDWFLKEEIAATAKALCPILKAKAPEIIYLPHPGEWHPDHKACLPIIRRALAHTGLRAALRAYEIWTPLGAYDYVENISSVMAQKIRAVRCHRSQMHEFPYDRAISGLNQYRGVIAAKARFAEVFQTIAMRKCD